MAGGNVDIFAILDWVLIYNLQIRIFVFSNLFSINVTIRLNHLQFNKGIVLFLNYLQMCTVKKPSKIEIHYF